MMAFCKSFFCLLGTTPVQHALEVKTKSGEVWNYCKLLYGRRFFKTQTIANKRFKNKASVSKITLFPKKERLQPTDFGSREMTMTMLWKPFIFTLSFSACSLAGCAIWQYENMRKRAMSFIREPSLWYPDKLFWRNKKRVSWRDEINKFWNDLSDGERLFFPILIANIAVFIAWRVPQWQTVMIRYFSSSPNNSAICLPLVLSTFSHYSLVHLVLNMYALNSFLQSGVLALGKEQFLALFLIGGVISSFSSLFLRVVRNKPGLSLGASGAIMATVGYMCTKYPDMELSIIGMPWFTFAAGSAIKALIMFDLTGLVLGWKFLDHAAHLGGAFTGIFWSYWGNTYLWQKREPLLQWWHELRNAVK